jgi:hypothetical protein
MDTTKPQNRASFAMIAAKVVVAAIVLGYIALFYFIAFRRLRYPLQLEWIKGAVLDMVRRAAHHQAVYAFPSKSYIPLIYTPVYAYVGAMLGHFTGINLMTLRLLSILATSGCGVIIFRYVQRVSRDSFAAWLAMGLFFALYAQTDGWFDLGRVDMLYLFFLLLGVDAAQRGLSIWAAVAFAVAFQTKQSGALIAVFVLAHDLHRPRKLIEGLGTFAVLAGLSSWWLNHQSQGWYKYYTVYLPAHHRWIIPKVVTFALHDLVHPLAVAIGMVILALALVLCGRVKDVRQRNFVACTTAGIILSALSSRLHLGGSTNVTLPLYAWLCMLFGVSVALVLAQAKEFSGPISPALQLVVIAICGLQFLQLFYHPDVFVPTPLQMAYAKDVQRRTSEMRGAVFSFHNVVDSGAAGDEALTNSMAIWDVLRADHGPAAQALRAELIRWFQQKEYAELISEGAPTDLDTWEVESLQDITSAAAKAYPYQERLIPAEEWGGMYFNPNTPMIRPQYVYRPAP